jgi:hypothetical protein
MSNQLKNKVHQVVNQNIHKRKHLSFLMNVFSEEKELNKCFLFYFFLQTGGMNNFVDVGLILI